MKLYLSFIFIDSGSSGAEELEQTRRHISRLLTVVQDSKKVVKFLNCNKGILKTTVVSFITRCFKVVFGIQLFPYLSLKAQSTVHESFKYLLLVCGYIV